MRGTAIKKYEIRTDEGYFIQAGETEGNKYIQIVLSCPSTELRKMETLMVSLNKDQWDTFCSFRYDLHVEENENADTE